MLVSCLRLGTPYVSLKSLLRLNDVVSKVMQTSHLYWYTTILTAGSVNLSQLNEACMPSMHIINLHEPLCLYHLPNSITPVRLLTYDDFLLGNIRIM